MFLLHAKNILIDKIISLIINFIITNNFRKYILILDEEDYRLLKNIISDNKLSSNEKTPDNIFKIFSNNICKDKREWINSQDSLIILKIFKLFNDNKCSFFEYFNGLSFVEENGYWSLK